MGGINRESFKKRGANKKMKAKIHGLLAALTWFAGVHEVTAQPARFFRITGPAATTINSFNRDGTLVWSNAQSGATYTVQTVAFLPGGTNWVDYVQLPSTNSVTTNLIVAFHPPAGMTLIPAGIFTMGDTLDGESDAIPTNVTVSGFYLDVNLVSYGRWLDVYSWATNNGYAFNNAGAGKAANYPVLTVDWYDVVKWCNARSQREGLTPVYYTDAGWTKAYTNGETDSVYVNWSANGYRLPTEAGWEKAARGGLSGLRFPWGNTISEAQANYKGDTVSYSYDLGPSGYNAVFATGGFPYSSPVGYFPPNNYGLHDMSGNAFQWCWDWYGEQYAGGDNPHGAESGTARVIRGGNWINDAVNARSANRNAFYPSIALFVDTGFRCVRGL